MRRNEAFYALAQKLHIACSNLKTTRLADGKIFPPFFCDCLDDVSKNIAEDKRNRDCVREFSPKSQHRWEFLNPKATAFDISRLLSIGKGRTKAKIRAQCLKPRFTEELLRQFLADQMEVSATDIRPDMPVSQIRLPVADNDSHSWLTFVVWGDELFNKNAAEADSLTDMTVQELFKYWLAEPRIV